MRRAFIVIAAVLAACQPSQSPGPQDEGDRAVGTAPVGEARGRFLARDTAGLEHALELRKLAVDVTRQPGLVRSHLTVEVETGATGLSEAVFRLPVPRGAAVTGAVLWVNDKPMRGAFVERQRARDIYTSIVTRRRDPALVTWDGPGWMGVSIFPLEKNRPRRFEVDWVEPAAVTDGRIQYRVPTVVQGNHVVGRASVNVDGRKVRDDARDLIAIAPADPHQVFTARAPGDPFQQIMLRDAGATGAPHFVLVLETSAAMTRADRQRQRAIIDGLFAELPPEAKVTILAADWDVSPIVEDASASAWPDALARLDAIPSAGALHLERALRDAAARAHKVGAAAVLFVGRGEDGFRGDSLSAPLAELREAHVRLSVVVLGTDDVPHRLAQAAAETGGEVVVGRAFEESRTALDDALRPRPDHPALDARSEGEWHRLRTVTGGAVWLGRSLGAESALGAETVRAEAGSTLAADLSSLWLRARLEWHDRDAGDDVANVLTPVTSLLVLETAQDYRRFGLAMPDPVAMEQKSAGMRHKGEEGKMGLRGLRAPPESGSAAEVPAAGSAEEQTRNADLLGLLASSEGSPQLGRASVIGGLGLQGTGSGSGGTGEHTIGVGNLGTIGKGSADGATINGSGYGRGAAGLGGRRARAPEVIPGVANVRGSLDKEIIRRIIRRHISEVRYCYEQELVKTPSLAGRILVLFTVAASGDVIASTLQNSTMGGARVEACTVQAVRRWEFPKPIDGTLVVVSIPFVLTPAGADVVRAPQPPVPPPPRPIDEALATLAKGAGVEQILRISSLLGLRRLSIAEALAWTIDRRTGGLETRLLVARLLEVSQHHHDAIRVLSEAASATAPSIAAELRRMNADADAAEVLRLAAR